MKNIILTIFIAIFPLVAGAQTTKVIQLKPEDSKEAKAKYEALQAAQKAWDEVSAKVGKKYTLGKPHVQNEINLGYYIIGQKPYLEGWENGFNFSSDFLYIVANSEDNTIQYQDSSPMMRFNLSVPTGDSGTLAPNEGTGDISITCDGRPCEGGSGTSDSDDILPHKEQSLPTFPNGGKLELITPKS